MSRVIQAHYYLPGYSHSTSISRSLHVTWNSVPTGARSIMDSIALMSPPGVSPS